MKFTVNTNMVSIIPSRWCAGDCYWCGSLANPNDRQVDRPSPGGIGGVKHSGNGYSITGKPCPAIGGMGGELQI